MLLLLGLRALPPLGDAAAAAASMLLLGGVLLRLLTLKQLAMLPCCSSRGEETALRPLSVLLPLALLLLLLMELTRSTEGARERLLAMLLQLPTMSGTTRLSCFSLCAKKQVDLRGQSAPLVHSCVRKLQEEQKRANRWRRQPLSVMTWQRPALTRCTCVITQLGMQCDRLQLQAGTLLHQTANYEHMYGRDASSCSPLWVQPALEDCV